MDKVVTLLLIVAVVGGIVYYRGKTSSVLQRSQIIFPHGGEALVTGKTYQLVWTGGPDPIQLFLIDTSLLGQGVSVSIVDRVYGIKNIHTYSYSVPVTARSGTYEFQIGTALSNPFHIIEAH